jgi:hypothetical protein
MILPLCLHHVELIMNTSAPVRLVFQDRCEEYRPVRILIIPTYRIEQIGKFNEIEIARSRIRWMLNQR